MQLKDFLKYEHIVIQCHDNPDADALASGYALKWYFEQNHKSKNVKFIYRGRNEIQKSNLLIMVKELEIPIEYAPFIAEEPELLITVDCQYGEKNVTKTAAKHVAIIDHHKKAVDTPSGMSNIRSDVGSCSTVVWDMIKSEGFDPNENRLVATALYYGLFSDTNKLSEVSHPLDRDMMDALIYNKSVVTSMVNSNISLD